MLEHELHRPLLSPVEGVDSRVDHQAAGAEYLLTVPAIPVPERIAQGQEDVI